MMTQRADVGGRIRHMGGTYRGLWAVMAMIALSATAPAGAATNATPPRTRWAPEAPVRVHGRAAPGQRWSSRSRRVAGHAGGRADAG